MKVLFLLLVLTGYGHSLDEYLGARGTWILNQTESVKASYGTMKYFAPSLDPIETALDRAKVAPADEFYEIDEKTITYHIKDKKWTYAIDKWDYEGSGASIVLQTNNPANPGGREAHYFMLVVKGDMMYLTKPFLGCYVTHVFNRKQK